MKEIVVVLSTYNGEKFLRQQISSIVSQIDVKVNLLVRDDGSKDRTCLILEEYKQQGVLSWYTGDNLKPAKSFFHLLCNAPSCEYYAFADQDDIWHKDKLITAIRALEKESNEMSKDTPLLYFCNKNIVDTEGKLIEYRHNVFSQSTERAFLECFASGCCMVFNDAMRLMVIKHLPTCNILHDQWVYILANIFGRVIYDDRPMMDYRQHANNVVGSVKESTLTKTRYLFHGHIKVLSASIIAKDVLSSCCDVLKVEDIKILQAIATYDSYLGSKIKLLFSPRFVVANKSIVAKVYSKFKILFNKL